jgi:hypothetical protein
MLHRLHTLCFEVDESGGADEAPEPEAVDEAPAAGAIDYEAPEFRDAVTEAARGELEALLQGVAAQQQSDEPIELDPYGDPAGFMGTLQQTFNQIVDQRLSQIQPTVQAFEDQQNQRKVEEWAAAIPEIREAQELLGEQAEDLPENFASHVAQYMATGYLRELEERYGPGERAVSQALKMAASELKQFAKASHDAGYQARNNELRGLTSAPAPVPAGARESVQIEDQPADELEAAARYIARHNLQ